MDTTDNSGVKMSIEFNLQEWGLSHMTVDHKMYVVVYSGNPSTLENEAVGFL